jgi:hypothetical protein
MSSSGFLRDVSQTQRTSSAQFISFFTGSSSAHEAGDPVGDRPTDPFRPRSATGRTLPHCYLEMASLQVANEVIIAMDRKQLGDRTVRIKWERRGELMRDVGRLPSFSLGSNDSLYSSFLKRDTLRCRLLRPLQRLSLPSLLSTSCRKRS